MSADLSVTLPLVSRPLPPALLLVVAPSTREAEEAWR